MNHRLRAILIWLFLPALCTAALLAAATSPLLEWRTPIYIFAGFSGVIGLILLIFQPLLAIGLAPHLSLTTQTRIHRITGIMLLAAVMLHIGGLWITSPPDVIDALLFASPTWFTPFGVIAMWSIIFTAILFVGRSRLKIAPAKWRKIHLTLAWITTGGTIIHALLIEGSMETWTKTALCIAAAGCLLFVTIARRAGR